MLGTLYNGDGTVFQTRRTTGISEILLEFTVTAAMSSP